MTDVRLARLQMSAWQAACLRHAPVALLSGLYLYAVGVKASRAPLWFDEILSYHIANLGGPRVIIAALLAKAENHPPLDYIARHYSMALFGGSELAFRLPSIIAMLVAALCLYLIVLRRSSVLPALVAFSFPFITIALRYSYEGRPYAFLFASMCLAFLAWQLAAEKATLPRLAFLTLCLALGPHSHYYGVMNYVPIAVGEAWRSWEQRRISWPIVGCFAVSLAAVGLLVPFAIHSKDFTQHFWTPFGPGLAVFVYIEIFDKTLPAAAAALIACGVLVFFLRKKPVAGAAIDQIPRHEVVAALILCLVPFTTFVLARLVTHAYVDKYLITTIAGFSLLTAYLTHRLQAWQHRSILVMALIFSLWAAGVMAYMARYTEPHGYRIAAANLHLIETAKEPIAVFDEHEFMKTRFYLPPNLREKIFFLTDRKLAVAYSGTDTNELVFQRLEPFVHMNVVNLCTFTKQHPHFLIMLVRPYSAPRPTWVIPQLLKDNAQVNLTAGNLIDSAVLSVTLKGPSGC